jgi:single-strand DNA-binding protein
MINKVFIMGRATREPIVRYTPNGTAIADLSVAYNRSFKDKDGNWQGETSFFDVNCFGELAEKVVSKINKGDLILIEGRLQQESWETKENEKRYKVKIIAEKIKLIAKPKQTQDEQLKENEEIIPPEEEDDIVF